MATRMHYEACEGQRDDVPIAKLRSPIEPLSLPIYAMLAILSAFVAIVFAVTDFAYDGVILNNVSGSLILLIICAMLLRRYGHSKVAGLLEGFSLFLLVSFIMVCAIAMMAAISGPYVDPVLARADALLGFNWLAVFGAVQHNEPLMLWSARAYYSLNWQPMLLMIVLFMLGMGDRFWTMLTAFLISLLITTAIFPFTPGKGAFIYHQISVLPPGAATKFYPVLEALRSGELRLLDTRTISGMVTFPSFHTSAAVLLAWGFAGLKWLRWPFILLNVAMIFSAIITGGHYLVDIIGGIMIAYLALIIARKLQVQFCAHASGS